MIQKKLLFVLLFTQIISAQEGYWDNNRATTREISVPAGERAVVKTEDFPVGTTEVVYRITLLDDNQQMANSLVSVLKSIPDPSGISQGSAGAIFIMSKISGDDKCKYAIFSGSDLADKYKLTGKPEKACLIQNTPVNKEAKVLSASKLACLNTNTNLWFGFESDNWVMRQKIILEVVPWVDKTAGRGWTSENKKSVIDLCKTSGLAQKFVNSDVLCLCILEKFQKNYKFQDFTTLMAMEKSKAFSDYGNACLTEKPGNKTILDAVRTDAAVHFRNRKYSQATDLLQTAIVGNGNATVADYNALGTYYLYSRQYEKAIKYFKEGEKLDDSELQLKLNLAHAYVLNDEFKLAKQLHKKYKSKNTSADQTWKSQAKLDIDAFRKAGIQSEDFDRVLKILED